MGFPPEKPISLKFQAIFFMGNIVNDDFNSLSIVQFKVYRALEQTENKNTIMAKNSLVIKHDVFLRAPLPTTPT